MDGCSVRLLGFLWARRGLLIKCKRAASLSLDSLPPRSLERGGFQSPWCNRPRPANNNEIHKSGRGQGTRGARRPAMYHANTTFILPPLLILILTHLFHEQFISSLQSLSSSFLRYFFVFRRSPSLLFARVRIVPFRESTPCTLSTTYTSSPLLRCLHFRDYTPLPSIVRTIFTPISLSLSLDEFKFRKNPTLRITINRPFSLPPLLLFRFKFKGRCNTSEILRKRLSKDYICITHGYLGRADLYNTGEVKYRLSRGFAARFSVDVERASD